jgi:hypothetical protein
VRGEWDLLIRVLGTGQHAQGPTSLPETAHHVAS